MATEILRPNAAGDETNVATQYPTSGEHWDKVDEEVSDEGSTIVYSNALSYQRDLYAIASHVAGSGTINFVKVYARCNASGTPTQASLKIAIKSGTTVAESSEITVDTAYITYSNQWNTNPATGSAWTWEEIDSLQAGVALYRPMPTGYSTRCTQLYIEVDYTAGGGATEKQSSDSGTGADTKAAGNPIAAINGSETGAGIEAFIARLLAIVDAGSGADAFVSLQTPAVKSSSDAGSGVEGISLPSATLASSENGSGIEALIFRLLAAAETGYSAEASIIGGGGLLKNLFASELGEGSDTLTAKIEIPARGGGMKLWT